MNDRSEYYDAMGDAYKALVENDYNWYICQMADGTFVLKHRTGLSSILECGHSPEDYGIDQLHQCWNGEVIGECPFDDYADLSEA